MIKPELQQEKIKQATEALEALKSRISGGGYHPTGEVEQRLNYRKETEISFDIRYWGEWENPEGEEDEEDYDWQVLTRESVSRLRELTKEYGERYGVTITFTPEEKCWITFRVTIKEE